VLTASAVRSNSIFEASRPDGMLERIHHALYLETREREGREVSPTAAIIDSQSAKSAQKGAARLTRKGLTPARRSSGASATSLTS
jgi:hypothetical protein